MSEPGFVNLDINDSIGTITFHHPKGNSLPGRLLKKLEKNVEKAGENPEVKVLIIKSDRDGAFCAGASFDELIEISNQEEAKKFFMGFARLINAMRRCTKFIIAQVQGKAVGGGVGIAAAADHTLAHKSADIKLSELTIGIGPFVIEPAVRRKIGQAAFGTLTIDATSWHSADWAHQKGLYAHIFDTQENLQQAVSKLAKELTQSSPQAMEKLKKMFWEGTDHWETLLEERAEISGELALSDYTTTFIENFKNR